ncbi:MAG: hypothetical protein M3347_09265 [Armatimonadota bacterium]|nr:hypothetical protein [Armatimonadota bacterium]
MADEASALDIQAIAEGADELHEASQAIQKVHRTDALPRVPVVLDSNVQGHGYYDHRAGQPVAIGVHPQSQHKGLTLCHEVGHLIDHQAFTPGIFASAASDDSASKLFSWRQAVDSSLSIRRLRALANNPIAKATVSYYLQPKETFGRSYAQYIVTRSGDVRLGEQLDRIRNSKDLVQWTYWTDEDFSAIADALDAIFEDLGWKQ